MSERSEESVLLAIIQSRDTEKAVTLFHQSYKVMTQRLISKKLRKFGADICAEHEAQALSVVQGDAFLRICVIVGSPSFHLRKNEKALVIHCLHLAIVDYIRTRVVPRLIKHPKLINDLPGKNDLVHQNDLSLDVSKGLSQLKRLEYAVIECILVYGLSRAETAEFLGISYDQTRNIYQHAIAHLQRLLQDYQKP